ncbi:MAG: secretin N-terminal domain-containing protein [Terriglobia bacterium]
MRAREVRLWGASAMLLVCLGCGGGSSVFREGRKAEARKDWDTALIKYEKALQAEPENAKYLIHERVARTEASLFHLKQGRRQLAGGRIDEATGEFQRAVSLDPTNEAAAQELGRLLARQVTAKRAREETLQQALKAREGAAGTSGVQLKPWPTEPLAHFRISADSRKVYETLAKLADLNVAFTSDFRPQSVSVDLTNVKIEDALRVVSYQTKTFWRVVTANTILIVPDTPTNRRDYEEEVLKTIYLSNPLAPADRTAITTALKQVLGLQRIVDNPDSNAIIIRDTPTKVAAAEKMIRDLDQNKAEILIDVVVVEADRSRIRDLGLTPATVSSSGTVTAGFQSVLAFAPSATAASVGLGSLSYRDYALVLPSAAASAVLNDSRSHILQKPQIRVTDGQTAKLRIGSRIPYATGSFLPSLGGTTGGTGTSGSFGLLASTQFQYQDVGVNLDLTPRLLPNGEVNLHASIEISSLGADRTVAGIAQPTFNQRKIEHDIRLKEGEVNLLGGLIETKETQTASGVPGLSQIPLLGYLFSTQHRERLETEVLVMLTPRVIRLPERAAESGKEVSVGAGAAAPTVPATPGSEPPPQQPEAAPEAPGQPQ